MRHVIVGTAGHIDHGKTALVKALTGIDADRLKEEKERGITIDIGFANLDLDPTTQIGFVDVPGHERFVKNMLAGIGGIDVVMLVVAADESIMPQTREHLEICSLLRVPHGLTVITKVDSVEREIADLVELEVREYLKSTFLDSAPLVRVSSHTGEGLAQLKELLQETTARVPARDTSSIFRLPVDRCFTMKGFGTVVTGTLMSGVVQREQDVEILPSGRTSRVRGLQVHGGAVDVAKAGQRTAVNLQGVDVGAVRRGMVLTQTGLFRAASVYDCHMELLRSARGAINRRKRIRFHVGTSEIMGYVSLLESGRMEPGDAGFVQIRLEEPVLALPGDRFIVRQYSPMVTIGGGEILEVGSRKHRLRDQHVLQRLSVFKDGTLEDRLRILTEQAGLATLTISDLVGCLGRPHDVVRHHLDQLQSVGAVRFLSDTPARVVAARAFEQAASDVMVQILEFHKQQPLAKGVPREQLRSRLFEKSSNVVFQAVLEELQEKEKISISQDVVHAFGRRVTLESGDAQIRERLAEGFRQKGLEVPSPEEVMKQLGLDPKTVSKILRLMVEDGSLVKINEDLVVDRGFIDDLIAALKSRKESNPEFGVGEFKDLVGVSRKYAIPLLEYLDRNRVTRRVGDKRKVL